MWPAASFCGRRPPLNPTDELELHWPDEQATLRWAAAAARWPGLRDAVVELDGPLGAGKTTTVRHLLRALGVGGRIKSPTYAVLEPYDLDDGTRVSHLDAYRLADAAELVEAGLREPFTEPGLKLVEWADRVRAALPTPDWRLTIQPQPDGSRHVRWQALTPRGIDGQKAVAEAHR